MRRPGLAILFAVMASAPVTGGYLFRPDLNRVNAKLHGQILDFTANHGGDFRIWSAALEEKRDLYVYLPPNFDPNRRYPLVVYMHGFTQDERSFFDIVDLFDGDIACGRIPPVLIAVPDGSIQGRGSFRNAGSFYMNSRAGNFEDYIIHDVVPFVDRTFPTRTDRAGRVLTGASMGGFGAYNLAIKYRPCFGAAAGIFPPLNLRYEDCHGSYFANYDPNCLGVRERLKPFQPVARFYGIPIRQRLLVQPLFGCFNPEAIHLIARENPIEMLETHNVRPGELGMFVGYGRNDEFNIDAQVESFLDVAKARGLTVRVAYDPEGRHNLATGRRLYPAFAAWLAEWLAAE